MAYTKRTVAASAVLLFCFLTGCGQKQDEPALSSSGSFFDAGTEKRTEQQMPYVDMPGWLDLYRTKSVVNVSRIDNVVIITFETQGRRDEVYGHYSGLFQNEENFSASREGRDIISFVKEGYGAKVTLVNENRNLWTLEYHKQSI